MHVHSHKQEDDKVISEGGRAHFQEPYWTPANSTSGFKNLTCCFCSLSPPFTFLSLHILFGENRDPMHAQNFHFGPQDRHLLCNPFSPANTLSLSSLYHTDGHNHTFSQLRHIYMFPHFDNNQTLEEQTLILFHASAFTKQIKSSTKQVPQSVSAQDSNKKQVSPACSTYCIKTSYYHQHQMLSLGYFLLLYERMYAASSPLCHFPAHQQILNVLMCTPSHLTSISMRSSLWPLGFFLAQDGFL